MKNKNKIPDFSKYIKRAYQLGLKEQREINKAARYISSLSIIHGGNFMKWWNKKGKQQYQRHVYNQRTKL